jgi:hypothetical protein
MRVLLNMKPKLFIAAGLVAAVVAATSIYIPGVRAQQSRTATPPATTNWLGYLVVGQNDTTDAIASGPHPTVTRQVQIGLRSDGVLVWRQSNSK